MAQITMAQALNLALGAALEADDRVVVMGEDVGRTGGVFRITDGLAERFGERRVIDTPVAESGIVGTAFGMAIGGMRPIAEIQFLGFAYPAYDQIVSHVSRIRNRSRHRFTAPLVIRIPYGAGIGAAEHHSESTEAIFAHTPGLKVVVPSTPTNAAGLLLAANDDPDPVVFLEPIRSYRAVREEVGEDYVPVPEPLGTARLRSEGNDLTIIAYGATVPDCLAAAELLAEAGVGTDVVDLQSLVPLDVDAVLGSVEKTGRAVLVQEAHRTCGFAAELAAVIQENALYSLQAPIERVTGWDIVVPLRRAEKYYVPGPDRIVAAARRVLEA